MNYTAKKPAVNKESGACTFGSVRDIVLVVGNVISGLALIVTIIRLCLVDCCNRKKDKKDEKERLEKEERDKIADIIDKENNKFAEGGIVENLKKCEGKFQDMVMFYGSEEIMTGLDVLRYMLLKSNDFKSEPLGKLQEDLDAVVRLFRTLHTKLRLHVKGNHVCPENTKKELRPLVADVGEIARSFVLGSDLNTISSVLEYFGNGKRDEYNSSKIERFFPYINALCFGETSQETELVPTSYDDQDFSFYIPLQNPEKETSYNYLRGVEFGLCKEGETIEVEDLKEFAKKIDAVWKRNFQSRALDIPIPDWSNEVSNEHLRANILHAVRVFMFKIADIIDNEEFKELIEMSRNITNVQDESEKQRRRSKMAITEIQESMYRLHWAQLAYLCKQKSIADTLEEVNTKIKQSIHSAVNNP